MNFTVCLMDTQSCFVYLISSIVSVAAMFTAQPVCNGPQLMEVVQTSLYISIQYLWNLTDKKHLLRSSALTFLVLLLWLLATKYRLQVKRSLSRGLCLLVSFPCELLLKTVGLQRKQVTADAQSEVHCIVNESILTVQL